MCIRDSLEADLVDSEPFSARSMQPSLSLEQSSVEPNSNSLSPAQRESSHESPIPDRNRPNTILSLEDELQAAEQSLMKEKNRREEMESERSNLQLDSSPMRTAGSSGLTVETSSSGGLSVTLSSASRRRAIGVGNEKTSLTMNTDDSEADEGDEEGDPIDWEARFRSMKAQVQLLEAHNQLLEEQKREAERSKELAEPRYIRWNPFRRCMAVPEDGDVFED
eukprot:TRINITY_DN15151_c0_g1_i1.p1 TRINITY_DN15151_c0_g1~~TRINITY_DN15151_c0_g1_i1.p1  ORF type:complete len:234 (+),score=46.59 TRINITY_DN15151_c0_g1_i1:37-702(+)